MSAADRWPPVTFTVHDASGKLLATVVGILEAIDVMHALDAGHEVRSASGAKCATKHRLKGAHLYALIWGMRRDPQWVSQ